MKPAPPFSANALVTALDLVAGKWKLLVVQELLGGKCRFGELRQAIPAITAKMLTQQLRELEDAGFLTRRAFAEVPPRVEYALTPAGRTIEVIINALLVWGGQQEPLAPNQPSDSPPDSPRVTFALEVPLAPGLPAAPQLSHAELTEAVRAAAM